MRIRRVAPPGAGLTSRPPVTRLVALVAAVVVSTAGWAMIATEERDGMLLGAEFDDASPLINGIDVKTDGVVVGVVTVVK
jgi:ABC-type transporter Mla subunit MlaD